MKYLKVAQQYDAGWSKPDDPVYRYIVERVKNSTTLPIHSTLSKDELEGYCEDADWQVEIT